MTRFRAAGIHLAISAVVATSVLSLMLFAWYPGPYFQLMGGTVLLFLLIGVDVCLGPLMTLIIFKPGKKGLKFDLATIAVLQLGALMYGGYVMAVARPVFTVFVGDMFRVAAANDVEDAQLALAGLPQFKVRSICGPVLAAALPPTDEKQKSDLVFAAMAGVDYHQMPQLFVPYGDRREAVLKAAKSLGILRGNAKRNVVVIDNFLKAQGKPEEAFAFLPIRGRDMFMAAIVDVRTVDFVAIIDAEPFPE